MHIYRERVLCLPLLLVLTTAALAQKPELVLQVAHTEEIEAACFSPDGKTLATVRRPVLTFWDIASGRELRSIISPLVGLSLAFSPDGRTIATGGRYGKAEDIGLWDVRSGQLTRRF